MLEVVRVPVLSDNYAWLVHDPASGETLAVDPGEAGPEPGTPIRTAGITPAPSVDPDRHLQPAT